MNEMQLIRQGQQQNDQMAQLLLQLAQKVKAMDEILRMHVTITAAQARALERLAWRRVMEICDGAGVDYARGGRTLRDALWRDMRREFVIASHHDLPAHKYDSAVEFVGEWMSFLALRRAKDRG